jgi:pilus assembly protein CpaE
VPVVALDRASRPETVMRVLRQGAREFLAAPFDPRIQRDVVQGLARQVRPEPSPVRRPGAVVAFASAKPGSGASTLACQTAFALGKTCPAGVLLADLDLAAGSAAFYCGCRPGQTFLDLLACAQSAAPEALETLATPCAEFSLLAAPETPCQMPLDPAGFRQAIDLARASYAWTLLDLPVVFHPASLMALAGADRVFLVATAELASLHLARRAVRLIASLGLERERVEVVVNQAGRRDGIGGQDLEKIIGCPVRLSLPDDRPRLHEAVSVGQPLAGGPFGEAVEGLAGRLAGMDTKERRSPGAWPGARAVFAGA